MKNLKQLLPLILLASIFNACWLIGGGGDTTGGDDDDDGGTPIVETDNSVKINDAIYKLSHPTQPRQQNTPESISDKEVELDVSNGLRCTMQKFKWAPGHTESILLDPQSDVIWPGSVLRGTGITTGQYAEIAGERKSLTISTSIENIGNVSTTIKDPKLSTVRQGISELLSQEFTGDINANMTFSQTQIHSKEHLKLAIEGNYDGVVTDITAKFNFNDSQQRSRYIVKFMQTYYTLDVDRPSSPSSWYSEVPRGMGEFTPVYVSSVKYGRMAMLIFESTAKVTELEAALKASFNGAVVSGSLNITAEHKKTWSQTKFDGIVVGGDSESGGNLIDGIDSFNDWVKKGTRYDANSAAAPLSYTLRFLDDNSVAKVVLSGEYDVRDCTTLTCPTKVKQFGPVGSRTGGVPFHAKLPDCARVIAIQIKSGDHIGQIVFLVEKENGTQYNLQYGRWGTLNPSIGVTSDIVKVTGSSNDNILCTLQFHYADGDKSPIYGLDQTCDPFEWEFDSFGGIFGRDENVIDQFGVIGKFHE